MKGNGVPPQNPLRVAGVAFDAPPPPRRVTRQDAPTVADLLSGAGMAVALALALTVVLFVSHIVAYPSVHAGDVATSTLVAPRDLSAEDTVATEAARSRARALVPQQFRADTSQQLQSQALAAAVLRTAQGLLSSSK